MDLAMIANTGLYYKVKRNEKLFPSSLALHSSLQFSDLTRVNIFLFAPSSSNLCADNTFSVPRFNSRSINAESLICSRGSSSDG